MATAHPPEGSGNSAQTSLENVDNFVDAFVQHNHIKQLVPPATAGVIFFAGLWVSQRVGKALRVSCAQHILGTVMGGASVMLSSAAAGQGAGMANRLLRGEAAAPEGGLPFGEMVSHGLIGIIAFKTVGGVCRNLMPSDFQHPGAHARLSLSARGPGYASEAERDVLKAVFERDGCHHCGGRSGEFHADHMPPSRKLRKSVEVVEQRLFPHCQKCHGLQSTAVKAGVRRLQTHSKWGWQEPHTLIGFIFGLPITSSSHPPDDNSPPLPPRRPLIPPHMLPWGGSLSELSNWTRIPRAIRRRLGREDVGEVDPVEEVARVRVEFGARGPGQVEAMEAELVELRTEEHLLKLQVKAKQSERGNALLGPLQWVGVHEQEGDEPSLMDLEYRLGEIEGRKLRIKREVRWLRKKLSEA